MRPRFLPSLVNDRYGDPAVLVDFLQDRRAVLFDLGDIHALPGRSLLTVSDVFVSHTHLDHFVGFDLLLRRFLGREKHLRLYGPEGFIAHVEAKLSAYSWNLAAGYRNDLVLDVAEIGSLDAMQTARFRLTSHFAREETGTRVIEDGIILDEPALRVTCRILDHRIPCLAYAMAEPIHLNVWKNRLAEAGLAVGPWIDAMKAAIFEARPDATPVTVALASGGEETRILGDLRRAAVSMTPGQKIAYVTDTAFSTANRAAIVELARNADILFIEATFSAADADLAADRAHLTTAQAGHIAREAGVARVEPFHFSARYENDEPRMIAEVEDAFHGR